MKIELSVDDTNTLLDIFQDAISFHHMSIMSYMSRTESDNIEKDPFVIAERQFVEKIEAIKKSVRNVDH